MGSFVVYQKPTKKEVNDAVKELEKNLPPWFEANPKRRFCRVQAFNGEMLKIKRTDNIRAMVEATAK